MNQIDGMLQERGMKPAHVSDQSHVVLQLQMALLVATHRMTMGAWIESLACGLSRILSHTGAHNRHPT